MPVAPLVLALVVVFGLAGLSNAQQSIDYQTPPQTIVDIADASPTPGIVVGPKKKSLLILARTSLTSIQELSRAELRLAGLRIAPTVSARSRRNLASGVEIVSIADASKRTVSGLPNTPAIDHVTFSPDGKKIALTHTSASSLELWVVDVASARAQRLHDAVNGVFRGRPFEWLSDNQTLVVKTVAGANRSAPTAPSVPTGPIVQQTSGEVSPARTYQDLLTNPHDEDLFEYYATSQIALIDMDGAIADLGKPALYTDVRPSPDGKLFLIASLERPFSYLVPYSRFPVRTEVWSRSGERVIEVASLPLAEDVPIGRNAVRTGRREIAWRADADQTLFWVEARDAGNPRAEAKYRDDVVIWTAPFDEDPRVLASLGLRFADIYWGSDEVALIEEWWWGTRNERLWRVKPGARDAPPEVVFDYSYEDRYNAPGWPVLQSTDRGTRVLSTDASGRIYLIGEGASPEGNRPFVDAFDIPSGEKTRLFHSAAPYYEMPVTWLDAKTGKLLTRRESADEPPNFFVHDLESDVAAALTDFPHPYPSLQGVGRELVRYDREDGVKLTATLYTPAGYEASDGALPLLVWAYPREYKSAAAAAQIRDSPHRFSRISWGSPLYWLSEGFAVMEGATMPIIGEGNEEPNDSYIGQLVASAQAAVDEAVRRGVADRERVAIGGHSYGAFMTANLLAHSDIFRAGIARSGAYNRTLTPFGFQSEQRTFWQAPEIYFAMSPFMHAHKINEPILLTHGIADNNSGTFPIQSRRLYHALKGHGAIARLVMFPHESHGFRARASVLHTLWEMNEWLDKHVKHAEAREATTESN